MKKMMILGAGIYQVPLLRKAREMGIYTIAVSIPGSYPGFALADEVCYINTVDQEAVLAAAREKRIDAAATCGTDVAVITLGRICDELGLPGLSYRAAMIAADKARMKDCFLSAGVRTARYVRVTAGEDPLEKTKDMTWPLIVKTVDSSGSRGITRIDRPDEMAQAVEQVWKVTRKDYYLVEEFIEGEDYGAQAFVSGGEIRFILPHGNEMHFAAAGVPAGHYVPYGMDEESLADCKKQITNAIRAMGLDNCAVNCDLILRDKKTYIVELTGRSGATGLTELDSIYYGFDLYEKIIGAALGEPCAMEMAETPTACASRLLKSSRDGVITYLRNLNDPDPRIREIVLDYKEGDRVSAFRTGPDRIGQIITAAPTLKEALDVMDRAESRICLTVS